MIIQNKHQLISESVLDGRLHMKLSAIYIFLLCADSVLVRYLYHKYKGKTESDQSTVFLLFFLEFMLIFLATIYPAIRYFINLFETFSCSHFQWKNTVLMILEFLSTLLKLSVQIFIRFQFQFYIPFIVDHIETVRSLFKTITKFISSVKLLRQLNKLPDVNLSDLEETDNTCLICLSEITEGKRIGCGHIFHKNCLRELIQGNSNQVCPKCRKPIQFDQIDHHQNNKHHKKHHHGNALLNGSITFNNNNNKEQQQIQFNIDPIMKGVENQLKQEELKIHKFSFVDEEFIIDLGKDEIIHQLLLSMADILISEKRTPEIVRRIKQLVQQILALEQDIQNEEAQGDEGQKLRLKKDINSIFDFSKLAGHTDMQTCGAISYALPKEASYNRSLEDECLRQKIELMNLLLTNAQQDAIFQSIFFGATEKVLKQNIIETNENNNNNTEKDHVEQNKNQIIQEVLKDQQNEKAPLMTVNQETKRLNDTDNYFQNLETGNNSQDRRKAWIEQLQLQVETSAKAALEQQKVQLDNQDQEKNKEINQELLNE